MSQEPEKEIEKQLREHADQRRAAAGDQLELHPATRRMLQGEVARTYGTTTPPVAEHKAARPWWTYWPGLLFASCVVLLLVVIVKPGSEEQMGLAKLSESAPPAAGAELAPTSPQPSADALAAAPAAAPSPVAMPQTVPVASPAAFERAELPSKNISATPPSAPPRAVGTASQSALPSAAKELKANEAVLRYSTSPVASKPQPAIAPVSAPAPATSVALSLPAEPRAATSQPELKMKRMQEGQFALDTSAGAPPASTAPSATAAPATEANRAKLTIIQSNSLRMDPGGIYYTTTLADSASTAVGQRFVQTPSRSDMRRNYQSPPSPEIMDQFQVQQNGEEVKITDSDGSVYVGNMLLPEAESTAVPRDQFEKEAARTQMNSDERNRLGSAATTRGALGGPVSAGNASRAFRATGLNRTLNQPVVIDGAFLEMVPPALSGGAKTEALKKDAAKPAPPLPQLQIQGRVQIGDRQELIINAVPVNR